MNDREQFEAWARGRGNVLRSTVEGHEYQSQVAEIRLEGWIACAESKQAELDKANAQVELWHSAYENAHKQAMDNGHARDKANARAEQLYSQLPKGMKHCTIVFKECERGHGRLTATNWVQHECPTCVLELANARIAQIEYDLKMIESQAVLIGVNECSRIAKDALIESSDTWLLEHDKAVEVRVLEEIMGLTHARWCVSANDFSSILFATIESRK